MNRAINLMARGCDFCEPGKGLGRCAFIKGHNKVPGKPSLQRSIRSIHAHKMRNLQSFAIFLDSIMAHR
jgi:hypothetical protein